MSLSVYFATIISPSSNFSSSSSFVDPTTTFAETDLLPTPVPFAIISPITWTFIKFDVPDTPSGIPAVNTVKSPSWT